MRKPSQENAYMLDKARRYCAYQERCVFDLKKKLFEWKVRPVVADRIISTLEEEDYLNEERFARVFAGGKFRIKKWGRNKIMAELRARKVPDQIILTGLDEIDEHEYIKVLKETIEKKKSSMGDMNIASNRRKLFNFAQGRGFESYLILKYI